MLKHRYQLTLASPAFLGNADQKGVWRTPPLKALIREWWRIAVARDVGYSHAELKQRETALFGTAADDSREGNRQSKIRLALAHWRNDTPHKHEPLPKVDHPEAERAGKKVEPLNYLGFGPIDKGVLKFGAALQAKDTNTLRLALPDTEQPDLERALTLAHWFGTIGGRSRNGWGSLLWTAAEGTPDLPALSRAALENSGCTRALRDCLTLDWPHAIGSDAKGVLVWRSSKAFKDWREAMKFLAETKIDFRTKLPLVGGQPHREPQGRHVLAYPVTHHRVSPWEGQNKGRLANTLRFKLDLESDGLHALIYHTPCKPNLPHDNLGLPGLLDTWQRVHHLLDDHAELARLV